MKCENLWCGFWDKYNCLKKEDIELDERGVCKTQKENYVDVNEYLKREDWEFNELYGHLFK